MELSKIKKLINSGYLTKIDELDELVKMTEQEMVNNNYLTHIDIFDGDDTTDESEEMQEIDAPIVDDGNISSQVDIMEAIKEGKPFKLANDVELDTCIVLNEGDVCNINLNGHTIKGGLFAESNGSFNKGNTDSYAFWNKGGVLNISGNGVVEAQNAKYSMAVWTQGGTTIINGGTYTNAGEGADLIYASADGVVEIYGGYFEACIKQPGVDGTLNTRSTLNVKDVDYKKGTAKITVYGGEFLEFDPSNNLSEGPNTNFVADGYISNKVSDNTWSVVKSSLK